MTPQEEDDRDEAGAQRRRFLARASRVAMAAGLVGGYGGFGLIAGRFLYPAGGDEGLWQFVTEAARVAPGESILYRGPSGETINIARQGRGGDVEDFIALSSTCPHLGCQVHWEPQNDRFFCPCHNGVFDPSGVATAGPPADAGQSLPRYPLRLENGLLFIQVPAPRLASSDRRDGSPAGADGEPRDGAGGRSDSGPRMADAAGADRGCGIVDAPGGISAPGHDPCLAPRRGNAD